MAYSIITWYTQSLIYNSQTSPVRFYYLKTLCISYDIFFLIQRESLPNISSMINNLYTKCFTMFVLTCLFYNILFSVVTPCQTLKTWIVKDIYINKPCTIFGVTYKWKIIKMFLLFKRIDVWILYIMWY